VKQSCIVNSFQIVGRGVQEIQKLWTGLEN